MLKSKTTNLNELIRLSHDKQNKSDNETIEYGLCMVNSICLETIRNIFKNTYFFGINESYQDDLIKKIYYSSESSCICVVISSFRVAEIIMHYVGKAIYDSGFLDTDNPYINIVDFGNENLIEIKTNKDIELLKDYSKEQLYYFLK